MIIREEYLKKIEPFIDKPVIKIITGMRRSGKSTFLKMLSGRLTEKGTKKNEIVFWF